MKEQIIKDWTANLKKQLLENYQSYGLKASGKFERNLSEFYEQSGANYKAGLTAVSYAYFLEYGRGANVKQDMKSLKAWVGWAGSTFLKKWIEDKGLNINSYAVAWNIARHGIKVPNKFNKGNFLSSVINQNSVDSLIKNLSNSYVNSVTSEILKEFKQNGNK